MTRLRTIALALAALPAGTLMSLADDKCTCRTQGRHVEVGQTACLATDNGFRLATCGMVLNNTSWTISNTPCVSSRFDFQAARQQVAELGRDDLHPGGGVR